MEEKRDTRDQIYQVRRGSIINVTLFFKFGLMDQIIYTTRPIAQSIRISAVYLKQFNFIIERKEINEIKEGGYKR